MTKEEQKARNLASMIMQWLWALILSISTAILVNNFIPGEADWWVLVCIWTIVWSIVCLIHAIRMEDPYVS